MTTAFRILPLRLAGVALAAATIVTAPVPVMAQDNAAEARIRKIESEVRALQRKVFPGADGRFFEPQIAPGTEGSAVTTSNIGAPATTAVTDILVRLDALEGQLRTLTARSEEQANALSQMETRLAMLETAAGAPMNLPAPAPASAAGTTVMIPPVPTPAASSPRVSTPTVSAPAASPPVAAPSASRLAAVQEIAKPQTADAGDDEYSYGFRLWNAGFYPEARQQLTKFVEQYPTHSRISFGRNLLGRAFLDDNLPEDAARWFLRNYQANKNGDRAADSLLYLGASMIAMKDTKRACIALAEFAETYPLIASGRLADAYQANRAKVTCN
ncbi:MAG: tetratricopeptide repeat protein [Erythrobacter sp.]|nr:tetratricopeptide repeat protein [Erythrobacter sp.]